MWIAFESWPFHPVAYYGAALAELDARVINLYKERFDYNELLQHRRELIVTIPGPAGMSFFWDRPLDSFEYHPHLWIVLPAFPSDVYKLHKGERAKVHRVGRKWGVLGAEYKHYSESVRIRRGAQELAQWWRKLVDRARKYYRSEPNRSKTYILDRYTPCPVRAAKQQILIYRRLIDERTPPFNDPSDASVRGTDPAP